jgi:hypothetical protein
MDIESYIKDLDPELQEKARACGSVEELLGLAKEEKVPIPDEVLAAIAGGDDAEVGGCNPYKCKICGSTNVEYRWDICEFQCNNCGNRWI